MDSQPVRHQRPRFRARRQVLLNPVSGVTTDGLGIADFIGRVQIRLGQRPVRQDGVRRAEDAARLLKKRDRMHQRVEQGLSEIDGHIKGLLLNTVADLLALHGQQAQLQTGRLHHEAAGDLGHDVFMSSHAGGQTQHLLLLRLTKPVDTAVHLHPLLGNGQKGLPRRGEHHPADAPLAEDKLDAQLRFQLLEGFRHGGVGIVQRLGGAGDAPLLHNGHEDSDVLMVHTGSFPAKAYFL